MIQIILILCFASLHLADLLRGHLPLLHASPMTVAATILGGMAGLWIAVTMSSRSARRLMDRHEGRGGDAYLRAEMVASAARVAGCVVHVGSVLALDWLHVVRSFVGDLILIDELVALTPMFALLVGIWWALAPLHQRIWEATLIRRIDNGETIHAPHATRWQAVWSAVRFQALMVIIPLTLLTAWSEAWPQIAERGRLAERFGPEIEGILQWAGVLTLISIAPALIHRCWNTVRIGPSGTRDLVLNVCQKFGVRVNGPWLWRTPGHMVNGAILGLFYPFRYILFTDGLLEQLSTPQLEAVVAHEVAHVRKRHLIWLGVSVLGSVSAIGWVFSAIIYLSEAQKHVSELRLEIAGVAVSLATALFTCGWISRRFEWQADAFAVRHMAEEQHQYAQRFPQSPAAIELATSPSIQGKISSWSSTVMISTLDRVARLNGVPSDRFSFRHGSIAERQRRLGSIVGVPLNTLPIDRQITWYKRIAFLCFLSGLIPFFLPTP